MFAPIYGGHHFATRKCYGRTFSATVGNFPSESHGLSIPRLCYLWAARRA